MLAWRTSERGAAPLDAVFGIVMLLFVTLSVIEVALVLYARNVVQASAHEGARVASELGAGPLEAPAVVRSSVENAAGGLVDDLQVQAGTTGVGDHSLVRVRVRARLTGVGPIPLPITIETTASALQENRP